MIFRKLSEVAPPSVSSAKPAPNDTVWHLTLDQIESGSGKIVSRIHGRASDAGSSTFVFDKGNVLYSKLRPYLNKVICPDANGIATTELVPLRPIPTELNREYLCLYLRSPEFVSWASAQVDGAKMPRMKMKSFWAYEIPLPPLDDQKRIAHLLGKVEGLIARRKQHLQQLDELLKSVFLEMFGDPVRNEKGWGSVTLGQIFKVASGNGLVAKDMDSNGPYNVYGGNGVNGTHSEYMFEEPTLVIGRVGYYCGSVHITEPKSWVTDNALYAKEYFRDVNIIYLKNLLEIIGLNKYAGRAAQPLVSGSRIYPIKTIDAPIDLQNHFVAIVEKVEGLKSLYQQSLTDLESLYGALSQKAFKGELDLSRVVLPAEGPELAEEETTDIEEKQPMEPLFELPAPEELAVLQTAEGRKSLLGEWLNAWRGQLGDAPFSAQAFMDAARQRLWELADDDAPNWGAAEYDQLKTWVFEALEQGRLTQGYDDANNRVQITAAKG